MTRKKKTMGGRGTPTMIRGIVYPSMSAAARALGISVGAVRGGIERGDTDFVGYGTGSGRAMIVEHNGKKYRTSGDFAREHDLDPEAVSRNMSVAIRNEKKNFNTPVGEVKIVGRLKELGWDYVND